jgi:hypothetical protein
MSLLCGGGVCHAPALDWLRKEEFGGEAGFGFRLKEEGFKCVDWQPLSCPRQSSWRRC